MSAPSFAASFESVFATAFAPWVLGALLFSALCGVAALAAERALRMLGMATRWPWALAMVAAVCWPLVAPIVLTPASLKPVAASTSTSAAVMATDMGTATIVAASSGWRAMRDALWSGQYDRALQWLWAIASIVLVVQTVLAIVTLRRMRNRAPVRQLDGEWVLVDDALGPAVIGVWQPAIVVPSWLMEFDRDLRSLVLRHEREHCRANDAVLVWLSVVATTVLPWNAAIWWLAHRLRVAMEIDCDARTLRGSVNRAQYGKLLLLIAQHKMSARFAPALSYSTSQLHRRIRAMTTTKIRFRSAHVAASATVAVAALLAACSSRIAANLTSPAAANNAAVVATNAAVVATNSGTDASPAVVATIDTEVRPYFDFQVTEPATMAPGSKGPAYPPALRAELKAGQVLAQYVVRTDGTVDLSTIKILKSDDEQFSQSVREALPDMRFIPAKLHGTVVSQLVQQPFVFRAIGGSDATRSGRAIDRLDAAPSTVAQSMPSTPASATPTVERPYFDFQVTTPANMVAGSKGPIYPEALRTAKIQGQVLVQFVVDATGKMEMNTLKILKSDNPLFSDAVSAALASMMFDPATKDGRPVKQLMQMPFQFRTIR